MERSVIVSMNAALHRIGAANGDEVQLAPSLADGGGEGFLSGDLLLIALGSCVLGSLRKTFDEMGFDRNDVSITVRQLPAQEGDVGQIVVRLPFRRPLDPKNAENFRVQAFRGGVSRRLVRCGKVSLAFLEEQCAAFDEENIQMTGDN